VATLGGRPLGQEGNSGPQSGVDQAAWWMARSGGGLFAAEEAGGDCVRRRRDALRKSQVEGEEIDPFRCSLLGRRAVLDMVNLEHGYVSARDSNITT